MSEVSIWLIVKLYVIWIYCLDNSTSIYVVCTQVGVYSVELLWLLERRLIKLIETNKSISGIIIYQELKYDVVAVKGSVLYKIFSGSMACEKKPKPKSTITPPATLTHLTHARTHKYITNNNYNNSNKNTSKESGPTFDVS